MARQPGSRFRDYSAEPSTNRFGPKAVNPFSPWQLLVEKQRVDTKQPLRLIATRAQIPAGTLFNWVRAKRGFPPRTSYTQDLNKRLAAALICDEQELADAYNASAFKPVDPKVIEAPRPAPLTLQENPTAFTVVGLKRFLAMLKASGRTSFTLGEIELTAGMILGLGVDPSVKPLDDSDPTPPPPE